MDLETLLSRLDLDSPTDFEYFEHFADLVECEEVITPDVFHSLLTQVDSSVLHELIENYFEDVSENLPDDTTDIHTLLMSIRQSLLGLAENSGEEETRRKLIDELYKFHSWYSHDGEVQCRRLSDGVTLSTTIAEALALCRLEKLGEESYQYDFDQCLDYELDEYTMTFSVTREEPSHHDHGHDCDCDDCGHQHHGGDRRDDEVYDHNAEHAYQNGLVDRHNPVIDNEFSEEDTEESLDY